MAYDEAYNEPETIEVLVKAIHGDDESGIDKQELEQPYLRYALEGDAGADLRTRVSFTLAPFERALVPTGIAVALPAGYVALVHPRSGLAVKQGVTVLNAPGTVDAGYRGEIQVPLINLDSEHSVRFEAGDRIAQLVIQRYAQARFVAATRLPDSQRSSRGFGSTGL
ncbi:deoxyuridine 5'-triphosphate nucleotidohydrolase [Bombiscardovia apis]|uniref:Deoxyuridine 5'-triphosphate nucleotidohydrolase n=1 Tax=Bombiscardovia apis TaxID=2932182 RepID=A0ABM8BD08_9BIFI|nr:dUTP diphosphatase [Bombiscardovia apis]BDR54784.1 deoxyuridine 5'-triphosphate nucleotidohydrolase [Bombiscardovia apis]